MRWNFHEVVFQKWRLSMFLKKYHDKIIKEYKEWICNIEISFLNISWYFKNNEKKILYCMMYDQQWNLSVHDADYESTV